MEMFARLKKRKERKYSVDPVNILIKNNFFQSLNYLGIDYLESLPIQ